MAFDPISQTKPLGHFLFVSVSFKAGAKNYHQKKHKHNTENKISHEFRNSLTNSCVGLFPSLSLFSAFARRNLRSHSHTMAITTKETKPSERNNHH